MIELCIGGAFIFGGAVGYWMGYWTTDKRTNEALNVMNEATDGELLRVWNKAVKIIEQGE